ncbi:MAG TPA: NTP transferase domain-containing protein [Acidimicrobiales bacterium]|nr:NTP transferase domain-containing protein [Acidimicrobiales bacterium]
MSARPLSAVVLAAGDNSRMRSDTPKVLHRLCGRPMILHVLDALAELHVDRIVVVVGHGSTEVTKVVQAEAPADLAIEFVEQAFPRGTGDAAAVALTGFPDSFGDYLEDGDLVVLPGDTPLVRPPTLAALVRVHRAADAAATVLTALVADPHGYGRIVRAKDGSVARIVEHLDASADELGIAEISTSIYCFRHGELAPALRRLSPDNAGGLYYLTDTIEVLHDAGYTTESFLVDDPSEAAGVNDRAQLAAAESVLRARINERFMRRGVTMVDPEQTYVEAEVDIAEDVILQPGTVLEGATRIGRGSVIGPFTRLTDSLVGEGVRVQESVAVRAEIGDDCVVGPFAVLEAGTRLAPGTVAGPFFRGSTSG